MRGRPPRTYRAVMTTTADAKTADTKTADTKTADTKTADTTRAAAPFSKESSGDGTFTRQGNRFTDRITPESDSGPGEGPDAQRRWPLEAGRYASS